MKKLIGTILTACLIASTTAAFGAVKEGSFSVTPLIGGYVFDGGDTLDPTLILGLRVGYNFTKNFGVEALYNYATATEGTYSHLTDISMHRFGGQALLHFFPDSVFVPYLAAGYSGVKFEGDDVTTKTNGAFDYGFGAKYFVTEDIAVRGDIRHIIYKYDSGSINDAEFTLGAYFQFGGTKPVAKAVEPTPEPVKVVEAPAPAPAPAPVVVAPVIIPPADSDGDGVINPQDACPTTPKGVAVDSNGCPVDSDKDRVADYLDKCPGTPKGVAVDSNGCPVDSDKDGVVDHLDKCPGTPAGVAVDAKGCTLEAAKKYCDKPSVIAIIFDTNKAVVKAKYYDELDKLGNFLKEFPASKGTIAGYSDAAGKKAANIRLSQKRAESVRTYIINKFGIDGNRITAKGFGSAKPVASNKTAVGKAKNRRIEALFTCE
jgi:OOP family OmpA-OmpF porin